MEDRVFALKELAQFDANVPQKVMAYWNRWSSSC